MKMTKLAAVSAALALATSLPLAANAAQEKGIYVGAGIGSATYESSQFADCFGDCDKFKDSDFMYDVFVGYQVTESLGVELGYHDWGDLKDNAFGENDVKIEPTIVDIVAVGRAPITDMVDIYGKAGVAFVNIDASIPGQSGSSNTQDLTLGGGLEFNFDKFAVRTALQWIDAEDSDKAMSMGIEGIYKFGEL
jgi:OOP family OmpA-OmpF porin